MVKKDENTFVLGTNDIYWSWEYDSINVKAELLFNINNGQLRLDIYKTHTKTGIGAGRTTTFVDSVDVGTLTKPLKRKIIQTLSKNKLTDRPFRRDGWYFSNLNSELTLSELFDNVKKDKNISRSIKLSKIKKMIKGV